MDKLNFGQARFTVTFDSEVFQAMDPDERERWVNRVNDLISSEAYVSAIELG